MVPIAHSHCKEGALSLTKKAVRHHAHLPITEKALPSASKAIHLNTRSVGHAGTVTLCAPSPIMGEGAATSLEGRVAPTCTSPSQGSRCHWPRRTSGVP